MPSPRRSLHKAGKVRLGKLQLGQRLDRLRGHATIGVDAEKLLQPTDTGAGRAKAQALGERRAVGVRGVGGAISKARGDGGVEPSKQHDADPLAVVDGEVGAGTQAKGAAEGS